MASFVVGHVVFYHNGIGIVGDDARKNLDPLAKVGWTNIGNLVCINHPSGFYLLKNIGKIKAIDFVYLVFAGIEVVI
jgi:hypothetical protein